MAIKAYSTNPKSQLFFLDKDDLITLNVDYLIEIMKEKFDTIMLNEKLIEKMDAQFINLEKEDDRKLKEGGCKIDLDDFKLKLVKI